MTTDMRCCHHSPCRTSTSCNYRASSPVRTTQTHSTAAARREVIHSPTRRDVVTQSTSGPIVEKVFEKSVIVGAVASQEQMGRCAELRIEAEQLRVRMNQYNSQVDMLRALQASFNLLSEENMLTKSEFSTRGDASVGLVGSLKQELEDQRGLLEKTRSQNISLHEELDMQEDYLRNREQEISRCKTEIDAHGGLKISCTSQSASQVEQLNGLREANSRSVVEISEQHRHNDCRSGEYHDLTVQVNSLECHQQSLMKRHEDLNGVFHCKTTECSDHESKLHQCEVEINTLYGQITSFQAQLKHLKILEEKYVNENHDLQSKNMEEGSRNCQISSTIHDLSVRIQSIEGHCCSMKSELEACRSSNCCHVDNNSNLQGQIGSLNNHIRVVTGQNSALTTELSSFVEANEALRLQLDRKQRVIEVRERNEHQIAISSADVHKSRSPMRECRVMQICEPVVECHRVPVFEDRVVENRVPVMEKVERTIEQVPVGHRMVSHGMVRSGSPIMAERSIESGACQRMSYAHGCGVRSGSPLMERNIESVGAVGCQRVCAHDMRSRSPLLHTMGQIGSYHTKTAATPTVHHTSTVDAHFLRK